MDTTVPAYDDVINEDRRIERRFLYHKISRAMFSTLDIATSILIAIGFFILKYGDSYRAHRIDIRKYCSDPRYTFPTPHTSNTYVCILVIAMFIICAALSLIKSRFEFGKTTKKMYHRALWEIWIITMNAFLLYVLIAFVRCETGIPRPYYFSNTELANYFCTTAKKGEIRSFAARMVLDDDDLRKSFPSVTAALCTFSIGVIYLYIGHFDINYGLHSIQHILVSLAGPLLYYLFSESVKAGEYHLYDVIVGAAIGIYQAMVTIRCIYGQVFYCLTPVRKQIPLRSPMSVQLPTVPVNHSLLQCQPRPSFNHDRPSTIPSAPIPEQQLRRFSSYEQPSIPPLPSTSKEFYNHEEVSAPSVQLVTDNFTPAVPNAQADIHDSFLYDPDETQPLVAIEMLPIKIKTNYRNADNVSDSTSV